MFEINRAEQTAENLFAGDYPVVKDFGAVKADAIIHKLAPVIQGENGIEEATAANIDDIIGLSADEPCGGEIVYYLTGEFFTTAVYLPNGMSADLLKPALRKLGIFLKELNLNA